MRQASPEGRAFIMAWEGSKPLPYRCSAGYPTIGVGHLLTKDELASGTILIFGVTVPYEDGLEQQQVDLLLDQDLDAVERPLDNWAPRLTDGQCDALISLCFNIGWGAFSRSSLKRRVEDGDFREAGAEFPKWRKAGGKVVRGLVRRRAAEQILFDAGRYVMP